MCLDRSRKRQNGEEKVLNKHKKKLNVRAMSHPEVNEQTFITL